MAGLLLQLPHTHSPGRTGRLSPAPANLEHHEIHARKYVRIYVMVILRYLDIG